ncbi:Protein-serine/threonine phosphatase [Heracleum sosnowskyi]|uniref:protein-serine/threonine phosphatase n=1 Tax=Heracleum sosnowskyi TaxID=360622 RepID=A0AAD8GV28_9APIA|nr:Protein-serine/threonine phosphatase [Heracleum sosnowskyi]
MERTEPLEEDNEFLPRVDSDSLSSTSSTTTLFTLNSDDTNIITTSSSGDISASSSSGEIPAIIISEAVIAKLPTELSFDVVPGLTPNLKCVGRNNKGVTWGSTSVIGRRREMEDAVAAASGFISSTCDHVGGCTAPGSRCSGEVSPVHLFGVYDGHGGSQVAKYCAEKMHLVVAEEFYRETVNGLEWQRRWEETFSSSFKRVDSEAQTDALAPEMVGSTAVVVVLSGCQIIISNCGDSRAVLCRGTETIPLTVDQKPDREDELMRIEGQGGKVINWNGARVFGVLAMSRAIGDWYLRPWIIPVPEITFATRSEEDECLILASDGLWDVMSNQEVGEVARRLLRRRRRLMADDEVSAAQFVADNLTEIAMGRNSSDNISIIVVDLKLKRKRQQRL